MKKCGLLPNAEGILSVHPVKHLNVVAYANGVEARTATKFEGNVMKNSMSLYFNLDKLGIKIRDGTLLTITPTMLPKCMKMHIAFRGLAANRMFIHTKHTVYNKEGVPEKPQVQLAQKLNVNYNAKKFGFIFQGVMHVFYNQASFRLKGIANNKNLSGLVFASLDLNPVAFEVQAFYPKQLFRLIARYRNKNSIVAASAKYSEKGKFKFALGSKLITQDGYYRLLVNSSKKFGFCMRVAVTDQFAFKFCSLSPFEDVSKTSLGLTLVFGQRPQDQDIDE